MDRTTNVGKTLHALADVCNNSNIEDSREKIANLIESLSDFVQIEREEDGETYHLVRLYADALKNDAKLLINAYENYGMVNETFINSIKALKEAVREYEYHKLDPDDAETHILLYEARRDSDGLVMCSCGTVQEVKEYLCREFNVKDYRDAPCYITVVHDYEKEYDEYDRTQR